MEPVKAPAPLVVYRHRHISIAAVLSAPLCAMFYYHFCQLWSPLFTFFGWPALSVILTCCLSAVICEALCQKLMQGLELPSVTAAPF